MANAVLMPKVGITVDECLITSWLKKVGDDVKLGDVLFTYETDKAALECESTAEGTLLEIFYKDGDEVPVLVNVCAIGKPGEDIGDLRPGGSPKPAAEDKESIAEEKVTEILPLPNQELSAPALSGQQKISPRARALAQKLNLETNTLAGTGPYGRIIERDVLNLHDNFPATASPVSQAPLDNSAFDNEYTDIKQSKIRSAIAQAMSASLTSTAQLTHHHSFDATSILDFRQGLKEKVETLGLPNITLNDIILFAVSRTLLNHPGLNAHLLPDGTLRQFKNVHLGIAMDTPRGLMVPTLYNANLKSLPQIAAEAKELAKMAQSGTINPDLLQGASFTVSNLGALGVEMFTPILNPPQTGILGVCNITTRLKQVGGEYKPYPAMGLSVTYDHRAVDGAPEARFALELIKNLENFALLLL